MADLIPVGASLPEGKKAINDKIASIDSTTTSLQSQISINDIDAKTKLQAHINSNSAHDIKDIAYTGTQIIGATTGKQAIEAVDTRLNNIIAGASSSAAEVIDGRTGADSIARASIGTLIREVHAQQLEADIQSVPLKHGLNII